MVTARFESAVSIKSIEFQGSRKRRLAFALPQVYFTAKVV